MLLTLKSIKSYTAEGAASAVVSLVTARELSVAFISTVLLLEGKKAKESCK